MSDTPSSRYQLLVDAALESYEKQTGMKLINHPLARQLEHCNTVDSIMDVLQQQARAFTEFRGDDGKVNKSLRRAVYVLDTLSTSTTLGEGIGLVCPAVVLGSSSSLCSFYRHSRPQRRYSPASPSYSLYVFPGS
jgi:fungal STAND N-terminal Goodbye domain